MKKKRFFKNSICILLMTALAMMPLPCAALADGEAAEQTETGGTTEQTGTDGTTEQNSTDGTTEQTGTGETTGQTSTDGTTGQTEANETTEDTGNVSNAAAENAEVYAYADEPIVVTGLAYNGTTQIGVEEGTGYTLSGNTGINAGTYTATAVPDEGYRWYDDSTDARSITWSIEDSYTVTIPADQSLTSDTAKTGNVTVSECGIASGETLMVTVRSTNGYQLMDASGNSFISYTVTPENGTALSGTGENTVLTISSPTTHEASVTLTFLTISENVQQATLAAEHKDTLTFNVSVK